MNISLKPIGLTIYLLATTTALLFGTPSWGADVYLDSRCQRTDNSNDAFRVDFQRNIQSGGISYWFSLARYVDGSAIFCLMQPNYARGKLLTVKQLQDRFIREIKQESRETSFLITVADGHGSGVRLTQFRLNLANPSQPKLSKLKEWKDSR
jgi:hypothetical protein